MAGFPIDLRANDATGWASLVRAGEVHPRELVAASIEAIERLNSSLNAFVATTFERALAEAERAVVGDDAGPFAGVPFAFKDYGCREAGVPYRQGMRLLRDLDFRPTTTSPLTERFRAAGLISTGRTNVPEMAVVGTTEPVAFGPTRNPWDTSRVPAGSSGGSAAAVAAGMVVAAHGNDIAGSIRLPAAATGLVGLKPSRGRVVVSSTDPVIGMFGEGVLTRSVRDTAGLLDAIAAAGGPWPPPALPGPLAAEVGRPVGRLRVGVWTAAFNGAEVDAACSRAAEDAASALGGFGHEVERSAPAALSDPTLWEAMRVALAAHAANDLARWERRLGTSIGEADLEPVTWRIVAAGRAATAVDVLRALTVVQQLSSAAEPWWTDHDLLITPASAEPAPPVGAYLAQYQAGRGSAFTRPFNATGQPALVIPWTVAGDGLPRGVQLVAPLGREDLLIRVGSLLEAGRQVRVAPVTR